MRQLRARLPIPSTLRLHAVSCDNDRYKVAFWLIQETRIRRALTDDSLTFLFKRNTPWESKNSSRCVTCAKHIYPHTKQKQLFPFIRPCVLCVIF
jgi:hypothetical protein